MSGISGCCGESYSRQLYELGLEKQQNRIDLDQQKNRRDSVEQSTHLSAASHSGQVAEGLKGLNIDLYA